VVDEEDEVVEDDDDEMELDVEEDDGGAEEEDGEAEEEGAADDDTGGEDDGTTDAIRARHRNQHSLPFVLCGPYSHILLDCSIGFLFFF
jgi:hypothetical protein